jgi:hypothetical protein
MDFSKTTSRTGAAASRRRRVKWAACLAFAVGLPVGLYLWSQQLAATEPQRLAALQAERAVARAANLKAHPECTQVTTTEVRDAAGAVMRSETHRETRACVPVVRAEYVMPTWLKVTLIVLAIALALLLLCCGAFEGLAYLLIALITF